MRNILALIGALVVGFAALGWYLEWYKIGTKPGSDGHREINVDLDTKKIIEDEQNLQKKVTGAVSGDSKGTNTTIVPNLPTPEPKKVEGQTTGGGGIRFNPDGSVDFVSPYKNVGP